MSPIQQQISVLRDLSELVAAPADVRAKADAIVQYFGRNVDLGWPEPEALRRATEKANLCNYQEGQ